MYDLRAYYAFVEVSRGAPRIRPLLGNLMIAVSSTVYIPRYMAKVWVLWGQWVVQERYAGSIEGMVAWAAPFGRFGCVCGSCSVEARVDRVV